MAGGAGTDGLVGGAPHVNPAELQILYGIEAQRQLTELTLPWLPGYQGSAPVRVGNAAAAQFQLDIYGELMDSLLLARTAGLDPDADAWNFQRTLVRFLESNWQRADSGMGQERLLPDDRKFVPPQLFIGKNLRDRHLPSMI